MKLIKCEICGNVAEVVVDKGVPMICCGRIMKEMIADVEGEASKKHKPILKLENQILKVDIGENLHPMDKEHLIKNIWIVMENQIRRYDLDETKQPKFMVDLENFHGMIEVLEYCNLHGLWKSEIQV